MNLRKLTIKNRLALGFSIILLLLIVIGTFSLRNLNHVTETTENIYKHPLVVSNAVRDIKANIIAIHRSMKDVALAETELEMNQAKLQVDEYERQVYEKFDIVLDKFLGDKKDVENAYNSFADWKIIREEVILLWQRGEKEEAIAITKGKGAAHVERVLKDVEVMIDFASFKANEFYESILDSESQSSDIMIIILGISLILFLLIIFVLSRSILTPIGTLNITARKIESGDLNARNSITAKDELSMLGISFNRMIDSIRSRTNILTGVTKISTALHGISEKEVFSNTLLSIFVELTGAQFAVYYVLDEESNIFIPIDTIGANKNALPTFNAVDPPGDLGNVIHNKDIHIIRNISETNYFKYESVVGNLLMKEVISAPLINTGKVIAFVSCGIIDEFSHDSIEIFKQSVSIISTSYSTLVANQKTKEYSDRLERTNEELERQSEELQVQSEELKQQSEELKATSESLKKQNIELDIQRKEVLEANRLKSEFLSNMSHELRTPLNSINALSKVLIMQSSEKLDEEECNYIEIIERNGKRLLSLINDILDLSKIEAGKIDLNPTHFILNDFLSNIIENVTSLADEKGLDIKLNIDSKIDVTSDEGRLYQVVTNIIGNAIKFTKKGEIIVWCKEKNDEITIEIQDTGIGISQDQLLCIFQEFRQVDGSTTRSYEGTGLGLAIAKKIVQQLNGKITCESTLGVGSVFIVVIPKYWKKGLTDIDQKTNEKSNKLQKKRDAGTIDKPNILIIEDNETAIIQVKKVLETEGINVNHVFRGEEGLTFLKHSIPDGIILDLMMPGMDGFEVLQKVRENNYTRNIPVIILTAKNLSNSELKKLAKYGGQHIIQKGDIDVDDLIDEVKRLFRNKDEESKQLNTNINAIEPEQRKIVLIEDNPDNRVTIKAILGNGYTILEAEDGKTGLELVKMQKPDLILLDISLPELDGFGVIEQIRKDESIANIPVIAVTAKAMKDDKDKILSAGCNDYVSKPIKEEEFKLKIKKYIFNQI